MKELPRDHRGYPIPAIVARDGSGKPHFVINDQAARLKAIAHSLCGICGQKLERVRWFIGGPHSAFHEHGAYLDPPMHTECAHFALQCCPYLAIPSYTNFADAQKAASRYNNGPVRVETMVEGRPDVFVAVRSNGTLVHGGYIRPVRPYLRVEYWLHGRKLTKYEGWHIAEEYMRKPMNFSPEHHAILKPEQMR